jgi:hypothetical protein
LLDEASKTVEEDVGEEEEEEGDVGAFGVEIALTAAFAAEITSAPREA